MAVASEALAAGGVLL